MGCSRSQDEAERRAARGEHDEPGTGGEQMRDHRHAREQLLEVVEDQE